MNWVHTVLLPEEQSELGPHCTALRGAVRIGSTLFAIDIGLDKQNL